MEKKDKYLGFRICFNDYLRVIEAAQNSGVSITDYILSFLLPGISSQNIQPNSPAIKIGLEDSKASGELLAAAEKRLSEFKNI